MGGISGGSAPERQAAKASTWRCSTRLLLPGRLRSGWALRCCSGDRWPSSEARSRALWTAGEIFELNVIGFVAAVAASVGLLAVAELAGIGAGDRKRELKR